MEELFLSLTSNGLEGYTPSLRTGNVEQLLVIGGMQEYLVLRKCNEEGNVEQLLVIGGMQEYLVLRKSNEEGNVEQSLVIGAMQEYLVLRKCNEEGIVPDDWQKGEGARQSAREAKLDAFRACSFRQGFASQIFLALQSGLRDGISSVLAWLLALCQSFPGKKLMELLRSKLGVFPSGPRTTIGDAGIQVRLHARGITVPFC
jgi:hypothetical protein